MKPYEITLDLRRNIHQVLVMKEGDANSRIIRAKITDNGKPYDISSSYITVKWHKPDGYVVENIVHTIIDSNTIEIVCTDQMLAVAGGAKSEVVLAKNDFIVSTMKFEVSIDKSVISNNVIESSNEFGALNDLLAKNNSLGDDLRELESQLEKAESERVIAENERNANEEIRKTNENNREDAENLRESNTTTAIQNTNNAANLANTATQNAEDATEAAIDATTKTNEATQKANTIIAKMESLMKDDNIIHTDKLGVAGGVATLDEEGFLSKAQIPDRTIEIIYGILEDSLTFVDTDGNVVQGGINKQYIDTVTNLPYVWSGTEYVAVGSKLGLGYTSSSAFPGSDGLDLQKRMDAVEEYHNNIPASDIKFDNTNTNILSAEVQGAIVELSQPATRTKDGLLSASDKVLIDNYTNIQEIEAVLSASKWIGDSAPYTQTITITDLTAYNNCSVELNPIATTEQEIAIIEADVNDNILYDESTGLTFTANGTKPTIDIPILLCVGTSMNIVGVPYYLGDLDKAENISYDNSDSNLNGTNVKSAIDELDDELNIHTHDERYYTESETDAKFNQVNDNLSKKQDASTAITTSNIGNQAVSKAIYDSGGYHIHNTFNQLFNEKISTNASCNKNWNWSGQGGQPDWVWGGFDGTNMYVYCPANFNVNHANYASYGANNFFSCGYAQMYHSEEGGNFHAIAPNGVAYGEMDAFNSACARMYFSADGLNETSGFYAKAGYCEMYLGDSTKASQRCRFNGNGIYPTTPSVVNVGNSDNPWKTVYAKSGTINTSDRTKKNNINDLTIVYEQLFMKLQPKSFMFNDGDRIHIGAISQDVEDSMNELGLTPEDFAGFCKDLRYKYTEFDENGDGIEESKEIETDADGNPVYNYSLRYQEFIFLTIHMLQKTIKRLDSFEERLAKLEVDLVK